MLTKKCMLVVALVTSFLFSGISGVALGRGNSPKKNVHQSAAKQIKNKTSIIDINTANVKELSRIKGIGKKRAEAIVNYRKKYGKFKNLDHLSKVKGFSKRSVDQLITKNLGQMKAGKK